MAHFYLDETIETAASGERVVIAGPEARHAVTVSRLAVGDGIVVGNGRGLVLRGTVSSASPSELGFVVTDATEIPRRAPAIALIQALAKADRDELAVQTATELGVDSIVPWAAARSVVRWDAARAAKGRSRWTAIVREASKQCGRPWLPAVGELAATGQLAALAAGVQTLVLEPAASAPLASVPLDGRDLALVVGPEGGIADHELDTLTRGGATPVRLGPEVLRTSSAGPAALAALSLRLGRW